MKKIYIICEGDTEQTYFAHLNNELMVQNKQVQIINIKPACFDIGLSNVLELTKMATLLFCNDIKAIELKQTYWIFYGYWFLTESGFINQTWKKFESSFKPNLNLLGNVKKISTKQLSLNSFLSDSEVFKCLQGLYPQLVSQNFEAFLINKNSKCEKETLRALIVDRDEGSNLKPQLTEAILMAEQLGYKLYISNPCFEIFLILHFLDVREYISAMELKKLTKFKKDSYKKLKDDRHLFNRSPITNIKNLSINKYLVETDVVELCGSKIGTNLFELFDYIKL